MRVRETHLLCTTNSNERAGNKWSNMENVNLHSNLNETRYFQVDGDFNTWLINQS